MPNDPIAAAQRMVTEGRAKDAINLIAGLASRGDASALFQQALWYIYGTPLPRSLPKARQALREATQNGHAEARWIEIALTANGSGAPADWQAAMQLLRQAGAAGDRHALDLERLLSAMPLTRDGSPSTSAQLNHLVADGSIMRARALLNREECQHIANAAGDLLAPAMVADPRTGRLTPHPIRTSDAAVLSPLREDPVIRAINLRIASVSATHVDQGEALTILRYRPTQQFRLHSDALSNVRNQRIKTVLIYLNDGFSGGATTFPAHSLTIAPRAGDAIIFHNSDAAGRPLAHARHAGEPVIQGTKWLATRWIRARPYDVWVGPEAV